MDNFCPKKRTIEEIVSELAAKDGFTINAISKSDFLRESAKALGFTIPRSPTSIMQTIHSYFKSMKDELIVFFDDLTKNDEKIGSTLYTQKKCSICINVYLPDRKLCSLGLSGFGDSCPAEVVIDIIKKELEEFFQN